MTDISIIIRSYNEEKHIGKLLSEIEKQKINLNYEIVLVDSGSTDKTLEIIRKYPVKVVHILPEEFSFGYSLNKGIEASTGKFLVFISAHCFPENENWLQNFIQFFENEKTGLVYGKQRGNSITQYSEHQIFKKWFPDTSNSNQKIPFCNNANTAIRKSLWETVKYDESLTGLEDLDWAQKIVKMGYCLSYNAKACIIHIHNETYGQIFNRYKREAIAYKAIFKEETFNVFAFIRLLILNVLSDYIHAREDKVFFKNFFKIPLFRLFQFSGTYRGYRHKNHVSPALRQIFYYPVKINGKYRK